MNHFDRKGCLVTLFACLEHWQQQARKFPADRETLRQLVSACREDHRKGVTDPVPWFALADLLEEHGKKTYIRRTVGRVLGLPGFAVKEWNPADALKD